MDGSSEVPNHVDAERFADKIADAQSAAIADVAIADAPIADAQSNANSPNLSAQQFPDDVIAQFHNEAEGGSNAASEDGIDDADSDDVDAMYRDGDETTEAAPGLVARISKEMQHQQQHQNRPNALQYMNGREDDDGPRDVSMSMVAQPSAVNPLLDDSKLMQNGRNIYHPNRQVNKLLAEKAERERLQSIMSPQRKLQEQSLCDWCFANGLSDVYKKLDAAGYTNTKMLSRCSDIQIEQIARELQFTTPQELNFKVAMDELRTAYLKEITSVRHPEEHRSLTDIVQKIQETQKLMTSCYGQMQSIHNDLYAYQMDVEREFTAIQERLNARKVELLSHLNGFFERKKKIINMRQQTLTDFIFETKNTKNEVMSLLQNHELDVAKIEDRKKRIIEMHDDVIIKYMRVKKVQLEGVPSVNTSFPTSHSMIAQISKFGVVEENIASSLGVRPVITNLDCEETMIKIKWELSNDEYGIDPETVKSIRIEWVEVNEDDLMDDLHRSISTMFTGLPNDPMSPIIPFSNQAMPGTPGNASILSPVSAASMQQLSRAISAPPTPLQDAMPASNSMAMTPHFNGDWGPDLNMADIPELTPEPDVIDNSPNSRSMQKQPQIQNFAQSTRRKGRSMTLDRWMSKQLDFSLYGDTTNEHAVNARK